MELVASKVIAKLEVLEEGNLKKIYTNKLIPALNQLYHQHRANFLPKAREVDCQPGADNLLQTAVAASRAE